MLNPLTLEHGIIIYRVHVWESCIQVTKNTSFAIQSHNTLNKISILCWAIFILVSCAAVGGLWVTDITCLCILKQTQ